MTKFKDKTVLITGGASGIGLLMARQAVEKGASNLIVLDLDQAALERMQKELSSPVSRLLALKTDITSEQELQKALQQIRAEKLEVDILINNAGVVTGKSFHEHSLSDIDRDMKVNSIAPMKLTRELIQGMLKRKTGHIVNISSAASMLSNPRMSVYCASKWAMTGWSDSLRIEMEEAKTGIQVLTVTPYYIDTGMFAGVRSPLIPILKPERVVGKIIRAIEKDKIVLRTPWIIYTLPFVKGILPKRMLDVVIGKFFGIYHSMDKFKGRSNDQS
ncbi:SDR family oxidoreductase [Pontixanthobacter gangjinensis]|uniref:SDR family oxidoreductase n=1 Tax=Christiangramia aestuarii TaxID=1028746 RepID=A0A7K1LNW4_9FLAO|nr:SDR family oxidoreductase [Christiangramia aestuarii]MUP42489.1 SDR family oxidoreductase [Christiangramia aestuarii]